MSFESIAGHQKQIKLLNKSLESGKIAHAYLFAGSAFVGKRTIAREFAFALLGSNVKDFHPDFLEWGSQDQIKIEDVREMIYKLSLQPYQAKYKVALIDNAENLNVESQNALLKTLEEPKSYTVIILVTSNPGKLLRTISSRAQKINFGPVALAEYENLLPQKIDQQIKDLILSYSVGRPGLAMTIATDDEFVEKLKQLEEYFQVLKSTSLPDKLKLAYDLADLETLDLKNALDFLLIKMEQELVSNPQISLAKNLAQTSNARKLLDQNVNSKLLLTNLMLNLT